MVWHHRRTTKFGCPAKKRSDGLSHTDVPFVKNSPVRILKFQTTGIFAPPVSPSFGMAPKVCPRMIQ
jgi:hypothetical protein